MFFSALTKFILPVLVKAMNIAYDMRNITFDILLQRWYLKKERNVALWKV